MRQHSGRGRAPVRKDFIRQAKAFQLRRHQTDAERIIWTLVRAGQLGHKFKRQQSIDSYIVDFIYFDKKLIIEVDGGQHTAEKDSERTAYLEK